MAAEKADGAFTNFLPLRGLPRITAEIEGAKPGFELLCRFFCIPGDPEVVAGSARWLFASYATVPVYEKFFRWLGHGDAIDPMVTAWRAGDREAALAAVPIELVSEIALFGPPEKIREQVLAFMDGGITLPILTPFAAPDQLGDVIEALGPPS
jgi:alkanesulfonate monooxygenase SsuD/methylene tetrahydromethanopterin reductase-like flavin-dependent oxidoreductase (luciferase family)